MTSFHGRPCWFELGTSNVEAARAFYSRVLGWQIGDSVMPDFTYHLAQAGDVMVAGLMAVTDTPEPAPFWRVYLCVDDCDATAARAEALGGTLQHKPHDIPGTGRFAVIADPQGVGFGILQPDMSQMSPEDRTKAATTGAFDPLRPGHCGWIELTSPDPKPAFDFYADLFGWTRGTSMPMGAAGDYDLFRQADKDIGGIMGTSAAPAAGWRPYFGVASASRSAAAITAAGGVITMPAQQVPGGAWTVGATDPQGVSFAVVGGA